MIRKIMLSLAACCAAAGLFAQQFVSWDEAYRQADSLIAFTQNDIGNAFWNEIGWTKREDLNYYDFTLNEANITAFIQ